MLNWEMIGGDKYQHIENRPAIPSDLYALTLHQAVIDLTLPKHTQDAMEWIKDPLGTGPTGFVTCAIACGYHPDALRDRLLDMTPKKRHPGSKPRPRVPCPFPGCTNVMPTGKDYCEKCLTLIRARKRSGAKDLFAPVSQPAICAFDGCGKTMNASNGKKHCQICADRIRRRKQRHPDRPGTWELPIRKKREVGYGIRD